MNELDNINLNGITGSICIMITAIVLILSVTKCEMKRIEVQGDCEQSRTVEVE